MRTAIVGLSVLWVAGCASMHLGTGGGEQASASLAPTQGNTTRGTVTFTQRGDRVHVSANVTGLKAGAQHAFHVHEKGDCSAADGMSAGGHFNPAGKPHGPQNGDHHAGDMPNLVADGSGHANASFDIPGVTVQSFEGKGLIVHRDADDYKSQPAGNAGPRLACGVIRKG